MTKTHFISRLGETETAAVGRETPENLRYFYQGLVNKYNLAADNRIQLW